MRTRLWLFVRLLFAFTASYFSLLAQRISNQKKVHPNFRLFPALLGLSGGHRNSTWQLTKTVSCCGIRTADGRNPPPILRCSARQMGTPNTMRLQSFVSSIMKNLFF